MTKKDREHMNVVIVGHVDHGKSTVIGRLLADTGSLPKGKLEAVKANCERTAKPFEYAFLLDALKDEQAQGITIDAARCFFKSAKRDYIIIDAPGHIEFLKNMVTGASRAEAALLVIDAHEGIQENSKRHGYMLSFFGIENITVCINKMDLVEYREDVFNKIRDEYAAFLKEIRVHPNHFVPISAREGENMVGLSSRMPWYKGVSVLQALDDFQKAPPRYEQPLRFPVQDIYKFTEQGDDRRIVAGRIETGVCEVGDEVIFLPSQKSSRVKSIEAFNVDPLPSYAFAGQSTGITLETQVYIRPGDILCKANEPHPQVSHKFKANLFWMGKRPLVKEKLYKLKLATQQVPVLLSEILHVLDASELSSINDRTQINRHDVAECVLETTKPVCFDPVTVIPETGRFVIVDDYEISGGGIILSAIYEEDSFLKERIRHRESSWQRSEIPLEQRIGRLGHKPLFLILTGSDEKLKTEVARRLEKELFEAGKMAFFLGMASQSWKDLSSQDQSLRKLQSIQELGELAHILTEAGLILIASVGEVDHYDIQMLKTLTQPRPLMIVGLGQVPSIQADADLILSLDGSSPEVISRIKEAVIARITPDPEYTI